MFLSYSIVPAGYDVDFLQQTTGVSFSGREPQNDGSIKVSYSSPPASNNFEKVSEAIDTYPVDYLSIELPRKIASLTMERNKRILGFTFMGLYVELDLETKANIVGVVSGLDRNPAITHIDWSLGNGNFVTLTRDMLYGIADAAFMYIQGCFTNYRALVEAAKAAPDINALADIDPTEGWPSGS